MGRVRVDRKLTDIILQKEIPEFLKQRDNVRTRRSSRETQVQVAMEFRSCQIPQANHAAGFPPLHTNCPKWRRMTSDRLQVIFVTAARTPPTSRAQAQFYKRDNETSPTGTGLWGLPLSSAGRAGRGPGSNLQTEGGASACLSLPSSFPVLSSKTQRAISAFLSQLSQLPSHKHCRLLQFRRAFFPGVICLEWCRAVLSSLSARWETASAHPHLSRDRQKREAGRSKAPVGVGVE